MASTDFELTTKTWGKGQLKIVLSKEGNVVLEDVKEISDEDTFPGRWMHRYSGVQKIRSYMIWN